VSATLRLICTVQSVLVLVSLLLTSAYHQLPLFDPTYTLYLGHDVTIR